MAKQELDLFKFAAGDMTQPSAGAPQIVRRNSLNANHCAQVVRAVRESQREFR